ncbi:MAG: hypothetical protein QW619_05190 [Candidatus Bathyarchaeia archaeon]|nr:hypothetical protein [Candidatus Bathyarchaeota archaeon]
MIGNKGTLGVYTAFPTKCHYTRHLGFNTSPTNLQKAILNTLHRLNGREVKDNFLNLIVGSNIEIILEFGVANGLLFEYLNADTLNTLLRALNDKILPAMDFLCILRYYRLRDKKRAALRFDFYLMRFLLDESGGLKIQIFHDRGLRRVPPEDLVKFLINEICLELFAYED